jgi:hypothetical protein
MGSFGTTRRFFLMFLLVDCRYSALLDLVLRFVAEPDSARVVEKVLQGTNGACAVIRRRERHLAHIESDMAVDFTPAWAG